MLLSQERAIVSEEAGTTRDIITEEIRIDPYFIRLADTAGLREAENKIERKGVERAQELLKNSELILLVLYGEKDLNTLKKQISEFSDVASHTILVLNKTDVASADVRAYFEGQNSVRVCALEQKGAAELLTTIARHLKKDLFQLRMLFLPTEFQMQMLKACLSQLNSVQDLIKNRGLQNPEIISAELRSAATALSDLVGETTPDSILSKIFSEFCIGKVSHLSG